MARLPWRAGSTWPPKWRVAQIIRASFPQFPLTDPGLASLKSAARAAIVMPTVFAFADKVIGNPQTAIFAAFGSFAMLVLVDFTGPMRSRLVAYLTLACVAAGNIVLGTLFAKCLAVRRRDGSGRFRNSLFRGDQRLLRCRRNCCVTHVHPAGDDPGLLLGSTGTPGRLGTGGGGGNFRALAPLAGPDPGHTAE